MPTTLQRDPPDKHPRETNDNHNQPREREKCKPRKSPLHDAMGAVESPMGGKCCVHDHREEFLFNFD